MDEHVPSEYDSAGKHLENSNCTEREKMEQNTKGITNWNDS